MHTRARNVVAALCAGACALGVTLTALACSGPERRMPDVPFLPDPSKPIVREVDPPVMAPSAAIILDAGTLVDVATPVDAMP